MNSIVLLCAAGMAVVSGTAESPWRIMVAIEPSTTEQLALVDFQRYIGQVTGVVPEVLSPEAWEKTGEPAVVIGTLEGQPAFTDLDLDANSLGEQGYYIGPLPGACEGTIAVVGATPRGVVYGLYGLLREMGFGFYLGSEYAPEELPKSVLAEPIVRSPIWRVRGVLPWYNFFNSPTTWDPVDHRAFVDQLVRSGASFLGFHTYDHEPFAAYEEDLEMKWGGRLLNTASATWGTNPLATEDFGFGTDKLFADDYFGAATTLMDINDDEAIRLEQRIMREALEYAHKRGLETAIGFEMHGDPFNPHDRDVFINRINRLLDLYPTADYIWIWQAETRGAQGYRPNYFLHILGDRLDPWSPLSLYGMARREVFRRIVYEQRGAAPFYQDNEDGRKARAIEGARLEQFSHLAYRVMNQREHAPRLVISGWGGEDRIMSAEYYEGLDKLLPESVGFSSLDHITPRPQVDSIYNELPYERERWPIPWLENDGDMWQPQPYVERFENMARFIEEGGSQGVLGIHWRSREVEKNLAYLVDYAWNPQLTRDSFFRDVARRSYGPEVAEPMADILKRLDAMGYRWVGGHGQAECAPFTWGPGEVDKAAELEAFRLETAAHLPEAVGHGRARLEWLLARMDWVLAYYQAETAAVQARGLVNQAEAAEGTEQIHLAQEALSLLESGDLGAALQAYARRVSTRGEYGVLATVNTKAVVDWRGIRDRALELANVEDYVESRDWNTESAIILPRLIASAPEGTDLTFEPYVLGGGEAWLHYRPLKENEWKTVKLESRRGWVKQAVLPADDMVQPGIIYAFSFSPDPDSLFAGPARGVTVHPVFPPLAEPSPIREPGEPASLQVTINTSGDFPVMLTWEDCFEANYFRVIRNGEPLLETAAPFLPDVPDEAEGTYRIEAVRDGSVIARSETIPYRIEEGTVDERFDLRSRVTRAMVRLTWPAPSTPRIAEFHLYRVNVETGSEERIANIPAARFGEHEYQDHPEDGEWTYRLVPVDPTESRGPTSEVTINYPPAAHAEPALDAPLTSLPEGGRVEGNVTFTDEGAQIRNGAVLLDACEDYQLEGGMTLAFEFRVDTMTEMPVILSHGVWSDDGWLAQVYGGQLKISAAFDQVVGPNLVRTEPVEVIGPNVQTGVWYQVHFVFDGQEMHLTVNGDDFTSIAAEGTPLATTHPLRLGRYADPGPQFVFNGMLRNVRIYPDVVFDLDE